MEIYAPSSFNAFTALLAASSRVKASV